MKKVMNKINFALIAIMASMPVFAADGNTLNAKGFCGLLVKLHEVFNWLRILAFIGAAFYIAGWAWEFISGGKAEMKTIKEKGTGLLVGFILLFMIGALLSFVLSVSGMKMVGCDDATLVTGW